MAAEHPTRLVLGLSELGTANVLQRGKTTCSDTLGHVEVRDVEGRDAMHAKMLSAFET
jgi:hypothetical protein